MGQRSVPAPFLTKTYELVEEGKTEEVISWGENGDSFVVWNTAEFAKNVLPSYFKHNNFSSFVRQLNTYGFRKTVPDKWEFTNENFKKGQKGLLNRIRRRKTISPVKPSRKSAGVNPLQWEEAASPSMSSPESSKNRNSSSPLEIADLSGENKKLRRENEMLSSELSQMKQQYDELTAFLTRHLKVDPTQILRQRLEMSDASSDDDGNSNNNDDENGVAEEECGKEMGDEGLRLFGVWFKLEGKKRGREML